MITAAAATTTGNSINGAKNKRKGKIHRNQIDCIFKWKIEWFLVDSSDVDASLHCPYKLCAHSLLSVNFVLPVVMQYSNVPVSAFLVPCWSRSMLHSAHCTWYRLCRMLNVEYIICATFEHWTYTYLRTWLITSIANIDPTTTTQYNRFVITKYISLFLFLHFLIPFHAPSQWKAYQFHFR